MSLWRMYGGCEVVEQNSPIVPSSNLTSTSLLGSDFVKQSIGRATSAHNPLCDLGFYLGTELQAKLSFGYISFRKE